MTDDEVTPLLTILQEHFRPGEEGWAWLAPHGERRGGVVAQIEAPYDDPVRAADTFAFVLRGVEARDAFLAICRWDGRPTEGDRELWRRLRTELRHDELDDMVVFNDREAWSMREEDAAAA